MDRARDTASPRGEAPKGLDTRSTGGRQEESRGGLAAEDQPETSTT